MCKFLKLILYNIFVFFTFTYLSVTPGYAKQDVIIYGSLDEDHIVPILDAFKREYPNIKVNYLLLPTKEIYERAKREIDRGQRSGDVFLSSAMDLQVKLVNDGYTASYDSENSHHIPEWAKWRNEAFGFTSEPAVIIYNKILASDIADYKTRFELATKLGKERSRFKGKIITYDPEKSGVGFMFDTQDSLRSEDFWYLARTLGDLEVELAESSYDMIDKVASGDMLIAYNVLGSYVRARAGSDSRIGVLIPKDYCLIMSRIVTLARPSRNNSEAKKFIDFLFSTIGQEIISNKASLYAIRSNIKGASTISSLKKMTEGPLIPIRPGPGLLVYLDDMKRKSFLRRWKNAMQGR